MNTIIRKVKPLIPLLVVILNSVAGMLCLLSSQYYLTHSINIPLCVFIISSIFGIYTLNKFTDMKEDFMNEPESLIFFQKMNYMFIFSILSFVVGLGIIALYDQIHFAHILIISSGFFYSYHLIPWYKKKSGVVFLKIKEILFLKSIVVASVWGGSIFLLPIITSPNLQLEMGHIIIAFTLMLAAFNNSVFNDILDYKGDQLANIRTIPIFLGIDKCIYFIKTAVLLWFAFILSFWIFNVIDFKMTLLLLALTFYPLVYLALYKQNSHQRTTLNFVSEFDFLIFGLGLLAVSSL